MAKKKSSGYDTGIPLHETGVLARVLCPEMQKFLKARRDGGSSGSGKSSGKRMTATGIRTFFGIVLNGIFIALTAFKPLVAAQDAGQLFWCAAGFDLAHNLCGGLRRQRRWL